MKRWSKLRRELYLITDNNIKFQIHCEKYRMKSRWGSTDLPRYSITLGDEIIFDYPKQFVRENGKIKNLSNNKANGCYPYINDISDISKLIREYIDTPKPEIFDKHFENDYWGLADILKAADRRNGTRRLQRLKHKTNNTAANKIIELRLNKQREKDNPCKI